MGNDYHFKHHIITTYKNCWRQAGIFVITYWKQVYFTQRSCHCTFRKLCINNLSNTTEIDYHLTQHVITAYKNCWGQEDTFVIAYWKLVYFTQYSYHYCTYGSYVNNLSNATGIYLSLQTTYQYGLQELKGASRHLCNSILETSLLYTM